MTGGIFSLFPIDFCPLPSLTACFTSHLGDFGLSQRKLYVVNVSADEGWRVGKRAGWQLGWFFLRWSWIFAQKWLEMEQKIIQFTWSRYKYWLMHTKSQSIIDWHEDQRRRIEYNARGKNWIQYTGPKNQMQVGNMDPSFTHQQPFQYTLTCTLNNSQPHTHSLHLSLHVPTDTFPKAYAKIIADSELSPDLRLLFESVLSLFRVLKDKDNIAVLYNWGIVRVKYCLQFAGEFKQKWVEIRMDRSIEDELDQMRKAIDEKMGKIGDAQELDSRIEKMWKRMEENEKIFLKFREDIEFKVEEIGERMSIQNTKMAILREDLNKLLVAFEKLSAIVCPIFAKINISSPFTSQFILQDRKIMYIGESGSWTQILFKNELSSYKKFQLSFKVVNSKRSNIVAGITLVSQANLRSSLQGSKADRKFIGLSGMGQLHGHEFIGNEAKNVLAPRHCESEKQRELSKQKEQKSNNELTLSSPMATSAKATLGIKYSNSNQSFKAMQIIRMCVQIDKERISWRNGNKVIQEGKLGAELRNEPVVPYFQFCDTGDSIECVDL